MALDTRPAAPIDPPPSEVARRTRKPSGILNLGRVDAVDMLSVYFALAFFLPGWLRVPSLGEAGRPSTVWGLIMFGWWIVTRVAPSLTPRYRQPLHFFVWLYLMAFLAAMAAGYQRGLTPEQLSGMDRRALTFFSAIGVLLVAADGIRNRERLKALLRRVVLLAIFPAFVGFLQFAIELDLSIKIRVPGLEQGPIPWQRSRGNYVRSWGTSLHAIEFGVIMAMLLGIAVHLALFAKSKFEAQMMWILAGFFGLVGVFANSRTQMVALACVVLPLIAAWRANWRVRAALVGFLAITAMSLMFPGLISGLVDLFLNIGEDESAEARTVDYEVVFDQIADRPWFGVGPGATGVTEENIAVIKLNDVFLVDGERYLALGFYFRAYFPNRNA
ncbi:MAG: O-antigen ligase family protein, partial [Acidobacteria bacterium]|nr:O-antigen ligase family protein [Acidobacteriota bacterium]